MLYRRLLQIDRNNSMVAVIYGACGVWRFDVGCSAPLLAERLQELCPNYLVLGGAGGYV
jgi:hypothetical protein